MKRRVGRIGYVLAGSAMFAMALAGPVPALAAGDEPSPSPEASSEAAPSPSQEAPAGEPADDPAASDPAPATDAPSGGDGPDGGGPDAGAADGDGDPPAPSGGSGDDRRVRRQTASVDAVDDSFNPGQITVDAGAAVTWSNSGQNPHTVTADDGSFASGTLNTGDTFSETFTTSGSFSYYCEFHGGPGGSGMSGVVVVRGADTDGGGTTTTGGTTDLPPTGGDVTAAVIAGIVLAAVGLASLLAGRRLARRPL